METVGVVDLKNAIISSAWASIKRKQLQVTVYWFKRTMERTMEPRICVIKRREPTSGWLRH